MTQVTDPFERAVERESRLRRKAAVFETGDGMMKVIPLFFGALGAMWGVVVAAHWAFFAEPRWLVLLHTLVFVLMAIYWIVAYSFFRFMTKRRPDVFGDT